MVRGQTQRCHSRQYPYLFHGRAFLSILPPPPSTLEEIPIKLHTFLSPRKLQPLLWEKYRYCLRNCTNDSILLCMCVVINHRRCQNMVRMLMVHLSPIYTAEKTLAQLGWQKYVYQNIWFGTHRFCRVNDFALSVPSQNFNRARTYSRGSPSTDKTGTHS